MPEFPLGFFRLDFMKASKVLVTGGNGFLGSWVVKELERRGYSNILTPTSQECDLTDQQECGEYVWANQPNYVIHLAATVGGIGANKERPGQFFYDNMAMGINLIEACRKENVQKFVLISTVCSYPNLTPVPFKEEDLWNGYPEPTNAPYGVAKRALMEMLSAYRKQYGFNGITLIPVNLYGPGDNFNPDSSHVIAALLNKFYYAKIGLNNHVEIWGSGNASREFLYVSDAAVGIVSALEKYDKSEPINLGTGQDITIRDLAYKIKEMMGYTGKLLFNANQPDGQMVRKLSVEKAVCEFGFKASTDFDKGLQSTIDWYIKEQQKAEDR
jgi:GDP-L-fucose synthase